MRLRGWLAALVLLAWSARAVFAGGCGSGPTGPRAIQEVTPPILTFPLGLAVAPDGAIWIASTFADKLVRFEPAGARPGVIGLPLRSHPAAVLVDQRRAVWFAGSGVGLVGRLNPGARKADEFAPPSLLDKERGLPTPWQMAIDEARGWIWFTAPSHGFVGRVEVGATPSRREFVVREIPLDGSLARPEGIATDGKGGVWVAEFGADRLARIGEDGVTGRVSLPAGSRPRGVASGPDGSVWVTLFGTHRLLRVEPSSLTVRSWPMPSRGRSNPYAVVVDPGGLVWANEFTANTLTCFDPAAERFVTWQVPTPGAGVRALAADRGGRVWFVGSYSGRLGLVAAPGR